MKIATRVARGTHRRKVLDAVNTLPNQFTVEDVAAKLPDMQRPVISYTLKNLSVWAGGLLREIGKRTLAVRCGDDSVKQVSVNVYEKTATFTGYAPDKAGVGGVDSWHGPTGITTARGADTLAFYIAAWPGSPAPTPEVYA